MKKAVIVWLIVATALVLFGASLFTGVMFMLNWDFPKLSTKKYVTNEYIVTERFKNVTITGSVEDVIFLPSEDDNLKIICHEEEKAKHDVMVVNNSLIIEETDSRRWFDFIGINFGTPTITVYLPSGEYGALSVKLSTGNLSLTPEHSFESIDVVATTGYVSCLSSASGTIDIHLTTGKIKVDNVSAEALELSATTGKIAVGRAKVSGNVNVDVNTGKAQLNGVTCKNFTSEGSTGDLSMVGVVASEAFDIERDTGDVVLDACDASEIFIETDTGDVSGSLLSEKVFITETDTGRVKVPNSVAGGRCEINTDTGDITITIE